MPKSKKNQGAVRVGGSVKKRSLSVTNGILKGIREHWCTYMEGARTENKLRYTNSKTKIIRGGTKESRSII